MVCGSKWLGGVSSISAYYKYNVINSRNRSKSQLVWKMTRILSLICWPLAYTSQNLFYILYCLRELKSSSTRFNPCFPLRRAYLLLYVESVYLLLSILEANTCVNFVHHFLYACLLHLLYCFVLTIIHEIYMLKVESNCWNLNLPMCCFNALLRIYCFMS